MWAGLFPDLALVPPPGNLFILWLRRRKPLFLPASVEINSAGQLATAGVNLTGLAEKYGTPLYVYNEDFIRRRCREYRAAFATHYPAGEVIYAGKAFLTTAMGRLILQEGLALDVVSGGELYIALQAGFPPEKIYFHGNNKSEAELRAAVEAGVGRIVVDSRAELDCLEKMAARQGSTVAVLLRVKPGVTAHTHHYIQTGQEDSKFGLGISDGQALAVVRRASRSASLSLRGIHCHIGSQILDPLPFYKTAQIMVDLLQEIRRQTGLTLGELNLGGGFGIRYTGTDHPCSINDTVQLIARAVREKAAAHDFPLPKLMIEPGRSIVGEAGMTLYTVGTIKDLPGIRRYVAVDGGMTDNLRCALYGARYEAVLAGRPLAPATGPVTIAGKACESGDILIRDLSLPDPKPGDVLVVFCTGAYHYAMFSQYNWHLRPAVVFCSAGRDTLIVRRQEFSDLVALDLIPPHLAAEKRPARGMGA